MLVASRETYITSLFVNTPRCHPLLNHPLGILDKECNVAISLKERMSHPLTTNQ
jgi:hypothetical protein